MNGNLGETRLRRKRRAMDPMAAFDALPPSLRGWLSAAALPWSPASARRIWVKARADGLSDEDVIERLRLAEARTLARSRRRMRN